MGDAEKQFGEPVHIDNNIPRDTVFYYSRERRLSRASPAVQEINDGVPIKASLSKTLFATRGHKLLFLAILFAFITFGLGSLFSGRGNSLKLGGNTLALTIIPVEGTLLLGIVKDAPKSGELYTGAVDIAVSPIIPKPKEGEEREVPPVFSHRIFLNPVESETYRLTLPFEGSDFFAILKTDTEYKTLRLRARSSK